MEWIKRIVLSLLGAIAVMAVIIGGVMVWDINFGINGTDFTNVTYTADDGTTLNAYLAIPEANGTYPAVVMVHEWWGLNAEIIELADELASEGYIVLAPDTYRGPTASTILGALYLRLNIDMEQVDSDMLVAYNYLNDLPETADSIGVIGFCYGGDVAFNHGIANPDIDAVITLYGSTLADTAQYGALLTEDAPPVLGIFGGDDDSIPLEEVDAFDTALDNAGIDNTVTIYEGVGHAFVQPDVIHEAGAGQEAWLEILEFFEINLGGDASS